jgi:centromere protein I
VLTLAHLLQQSSVTLEEIDNVDDFVQKLERIEPPGQMISLLNDPLLQKLLDLRNLPILNKRTELWLSTCLEEIYIAARSGIEGYPYLTEILEGLYRHVQYTKVSKPRPFGSLTYVPRRSILWLPTS